MPFRTIKLFCTFAFLVCIGNFTTAFAQTSAFTYQGQLQSGGAPANGVFDFQFLLFDAASNGSAVGEATSVEDVAVTNGLFSALLDPGAAALDGAQRWLEIRVRAGSSTDAFTVLSPRQLLRPTPYAFRAANFSGAVALGQLPSAVARLDSSNQVFTGAVQFSNPSNTFTGIFTGNAAGLTNLNVRTNLSPDSGQLVALPNWIAYSNNYPITVLAVGDSLAVPPSMAERVAKRLQDRFGANGYGTDSYLSAEPYPTNFSGAIVAGPDANWFGRYWRLDGLGAGVAYGSVAKPNGYASDQVQVFWIQQSAGGTFDLQVMANGGAWTTVRTLNGFHESPRGAYTNISVPYNFNRFRVINTEAKTNRFLFTAPYYSGWGSQTETGGGVRFAAFGFGGQSMNAWADVPAEIKDVILTNLNPALIISHNLEEANPIEDQWLPEYFRWLSLCRRSADVVVVGNYDFGANMDPTNTIYERQMWYTNAVKFGFSYFDLQTASGGFERMYTNGLLYSWANPHPNVSGQIAMARWFEERFDLARFWLVSDKSPPYRLYVRGNDSTNSPFGVFHSDAAGSSSVFIGGNGNSGAIWLGGDYGNLANAALFGNQNQVILNSPAANDGPYFARRWTTTLGQFIADGSLALYYGLKVTTGLTNAAVTSNRLAFWDANKNLTNAQASGVVPVNADGSSVTGQQLATLVAGNLVLMTSNSTAAVDFNNTGKSETIFNSNPAALPSLTLALPTSSSPGQIVRYITAGGSTSVTVSGTVLIGESLTSLPANGVVAWQSANSSGQWLRIR